MVTFEPLTNSGVEHVIGNLRQLDIDECHYFSPETSPAGAIRNSVEYSKDTWMAVADDGVVLGVGGISNVDCYVGEIIWFVGTDDIHTNKYRLPFWRACKAQVSNMVRKYYRVSNACLAEPGHLKLLKSLGFDIYETTDENVRFIQCVS